MSVGSTQTGQLGAEEAGPGRQRSPSGFQSAEAEDNGGHDWPRIGLSGHVDRHH